MNCVRNYKKNKYCVNYLSVRRARFDIWVFSSASMYAVWIPHQLKVIWVLSVFALASCQRSCILQLRDQY